MSPTLVAELRAAAEKAWTTELRDPHDILIQVVPVTDILDLLDRFEQMKLALRLCMQRLDSARHELMVLNQELGTSDDPINVAADEADQNAVALALAALKD